MLLPTRETVAGLQPTTEGELIGVVDSIIAGAEIASVSFAVPSLQVTESLDGFGIDWADPASNATGAVTALDQVADAVAMIKISADAVAANRVVVEFVGNRNTSFDEGNRRGLDGLFDMQQRIMEATSGRNNDFRNLKGHIVVDRSGRVIFDTDESGLGTELTSAAALPFLSLEQSHLNE